LDLEIFAGCVGYRLTERTGVLPDARVGDVIIADPKAIPKVGDYVIYGPGMRVMRATVSDVSKDRLRGMGVVRGLVRVF
jgi:hypothetical protein